MRRRLSPGSACNPVKTWHAWSRACRRSTCCWAARSRRFRGLAASGRSRGDRAPRAAALVRGSPSADRPGREPRGAGVPGSAGFAETLEMSDPELRGQVALDDPRADPACLALARRRLGQGDWAAGYAELVRTAGNARPIGRGGGSARASVERGEAAVAPVVLTTDASAATTSGPIELVIVAWCTLACGGRRACARGAPSRGSAGVPPVPYRSARGGAGKRASIGRRESESINSWPTCSARPWSTPRWSFARPGRPWRGRARRSEPMRRPGSRSLRPGHRLRSSAFARATSSGPWSRPWRSSSAPTSKCGAGCSSIGGEGGASRSIDGALIAELANALEGRVANEPRLRAWLRAEWTAWARQRYRAAMRPAEVLIP